MRRAGGRIELTGFQAVREALRARRRPLHRLVLRAGAARPERSALRRLAEQAGVPVEESDAGDDSFQAGRIVVRLGEIRDRTHDPGAASLGSQSDPLRHDMRRSLVVAGQHSYGQ